MLFGDVVDGTMKNVAIGKVNVLASSYDRSTGIGYRRVVGTLHTYIIYVRVSLNWALGRNAEYPGYRYSRKKDLVPAMSCLWLHLLETLPLISSDRYTGSSGHCDYWHYWQSSDLSPSFILLLLLYMY